MRYKEIGIIWLAAFLLSLLVTYVLPETNESPAAADLMAILVSIALFVVGICLGVIDLIRISDEEK